MGEAETEGNSRAARPVNAWRVARDDTRFSAAAGSCPGGCFSPSAGEATSCPSCAAAGGEASPEGVLVESGASERFMRVLENGEKLTSASTKSN
jgi:hypothetical protein